MLRFIACFDSIFLLLFIFLTLPTSKICQADKFPAQKARQPMMDPIPMLPEVTHKAFLEVEIHEDKIFEGRIVLGLFGTIAPRAVDNFRTLCACTAGNARLTNKPLCYRGSIFHRVIPNFMIQAGDFTHGDGTGGESIYGYPFEDEWEGMKLKLNRKYLLAMANSGRDSNRSQFFINTVKTQWLDGKHVVFGVVLDGVDVVKAIEEQGTNGGKPKSKVLIVNSGVLELTEHDKKRIPVALKPEVVLKRY